MFQVTHNFPCWAFSKVKFWLFSKRLEAFLGVASFEIVGLNTLLGQAKFFATQVQEYDHNRDLLGGWLEK